MLPDGSKAGRTLLLSWRGYVRGRRKGVEREWEGKFMISELLTNSSEGLQRKVFVYCFTLYTIITCTAWSIDHCYICCICGMYLCRYYFTVRCSMQY